MWADYLNKVLTAFIKSKPSLTTRLELLHHELWRIQWWFTDLNLVISRV